MDRIEINQLIKKGYSEKMLRELEGKAWVNYYSKNKNTGEVVTHFLRTDAHSLPYYLNKGFVLDPKQLDEKAEPEEVTFLEPEDGDYICPVCGIDCTTKFGFAAHRKQHDN